jgi:hypothetical protein
MLLLSVGCVTKWCQPQPPCRRILIAPFRRIAFLMKFGSFTHNGSKAPRDSLKSAKRRAIIGCTGLVLLSIAYCLPGHPSAGDAVPLDALSHVALFAGIGLWFGWLTRRGARAAAPLVALAALLEVLQWWLGGYARIEVADIAANEAGVALALVLLWLRRRWRRKGGCLRRS